MRFLRLAIIGLPAVMGRPAAAVAQNSATFSVSAGPSIAVGRFRETQSSGFGAAVGLILGSNEKPFGFRVDAGYDKLHGRTLSPATIPSQRILSGTAAFLFTFSGTPAKPYFSGGLGSYRVQADTSGAKTVTRGGFNFSSGLSFPLGTRNATIEAQLHNISQSNAKPLRFVRVLLGILI